MPGSDDMYLSLCIIRTVLQFAVVVVLVMLLTRLPSATSPAAAAPVIISPQAEAFRAVSGPSKSGSVFDSANQYIAPFFPSHSNAPTYSFPPDYDYMNKFAYIESDELSPAARQTALTPILGRLNQPGTQGYPYNDPARISNHMINDSLMAYQLGGAVCNDNKWVNSQSECLVNDGRFIVEGMDPNYKDSALAKKMY